MLTQVLFGQTLEKNAFKLAVCQQDAPTVLQEKAKALAPYYNAATFAYYRLLLKNLPLNSLLITNAENDTYPIQILQVLEKNRTDINVISLKLMDEEAYRNFVNNSLQLKLKKGEARSNLLYVLKKYPAAVISTTVKQSYWRDYYLNGLTVAAQNKSTNQKLMAFYQAYLDANVIGMSLTNSDKLLYKNMLPPLITLYKTNRNLTTLKKDILKLAKKLLVEKEVKEILEND
ncbi:hypothetical protein DNU06_12690 [Putridiphycobacter roseus]|uniref:Uncharacterized protein n=2 Tax=Putridiphycobacter roseus TaxID=2219161 RepID=A0A2W1NL62_9FLAO|nr:hypothetical protein DNU06_12690 [Putridiphycobacter roseus]